MAPDQRETVRPYDLAPDAGEHWDGGEPISWRGISDVSDAGLSELSDESATVGHQGTENPSKPGDSSDHCAASRCVLARCCLSRPTKHQVLAGAAPVSDKSPCACEVQIF